MQLEQTLNIKRLQTRGGDEVEAGVDSVVGNVRRSVDAHLHVEVLLEASLNKVEYRLPALAVVHLVTEAGRVHCRQMKIDRLLLQSDCSRLDGGWM